MKGEKQTELVKRAKKFHKLWEKGYSVADAADKMGISKYTIYEQLDKYAEINGVESRLAYIRVYSARAITEKIVNNNETDYPVQDKEFDDLQEQMEFEKILSSCEKWMSIANELIVSLDSIISVNLSSISDIVKEEKV